MKSLAPRSRTVLVSIALGLASLLVLGPAARAQIGSVVRAQKINEVVGGLVGPLPTLGYSMASIGDLNGDGVSDLVVGLPTDGNGGPDRGGLLVLFLNANGTVGGQQRVNASQGNLGIPLVDDGYFGIGLADLGDLDGDGLRELAVRSDVPRSSWIVFFKADGTVRKVREIPWSDPVFGGATEASDFVSIFNRGLTGMGDLDGDGIGDVAVGAPRDDDGDVDAGAIWILYLNADGSPKAAKKIAQGSAGFGTELQSGSQFGHSLACLGDLNGDGFVDLAAGEFGRNHRRWLLFLDANQNVIGSSTSVQLSESLSSAGDLDGDGRVELATEGLVLRFLTGDGQERKRLLLFPGRNGVPDHASTRALGTYALAPLGDLDGDGTLELAAADFRDVQSGGALWIFSLARTPVQNGSGVNPRIYKELAEPTLGATWRARLDCSGQPSGLAVLVDPASRRFFQLIAPHAGSAVDFAVPVPSDSALIGLQVFSQGACAGSAGSVLSNALYLLVGG